MKCDICKEVIKVNRFMSYNDRMKAHHACFNNFIARLRKKERKQLLESARADGIIFCDNDKHS